MHNFGAFSLAVPFVNIISFIIVAFLNVPLLTLGLFFLPGSLRCKYTEQSSQGQAQQHP